jgi:hypothetical protein
MELNLSELTLTSFDSIELNLTEFTTWLTGWFSGFEISGSHGGERENYNILGGSAVEIDRYFRGAYCLHHQGDNGLVADTDNELKLRGNLLANNIK